MGDAPLRPFMIGDPARARIEESGGGSSGMELNRQDGRGNSQLIVLSSFAGNLVVQAAKGLITQRFDSPGTLSRCEFAQKRCGRRALHGWALAARYQQIQRPTESL